MRFRTIVAGAALIAAGCAQGPNWSMPFASSPSGPSNGELADATEGDSGIRLVSFPSVELLPLWPKGNENGEGGIAAPFAASANVLKSGAGKVKDGAMQIGAGTKSAWNSTKSVLTKPFVGVRTTPAEPSMMDRLFGGGREEMPRTTREFFEQERTR